MNFQSFIDHIDPASCVLSVEKLPDGSCGKTCIVCGNRAYIDSLDPEHQIGNMMFSHELVPNTEYDRYVPKDLSFEENCFRAAIYKEPVHTYVQSDHFDIMHTVRIKETLELTVYFLASEIYDFQSMNRLQRMSTIDELTGVLNRNAMNNRVNNLNADKEGEGRPIGVVFADLNGLKTTNDFEGHQSGDLMLKNAAMALQNAFIGDEIYRAGGDEFVVFLPDASEGDIEKKTASLKSISAAYGNVNFAIGSCLQKDHRNILEALRKADKAMYEDKERFYREHPEAARSGAGRK